MTDRAQTLRARIYTALRYTDPSPAGRRWRAIHLSVLCIGLLAVILLSIDELPKPTKYGLRLTIVLVAIVFFVEYVVRLWIAPEAARFDQLSSAMARLHWATSAQGLVGLLAIMPAVMQAGGYGITGSDTASVFCILWILKLGLHAPAFGTLSRVVSNERAPLASVLIIFGIILMIAATAAHMLERVRQPEQFGSLPGAMWWAVVTLTTTGYGDVVPLTVGGRMIGAMLMISGIAVLALMTGVLATGFAQEERRREYLRVWEQVARVPIFASLGVVTLSEIVGKLRTRYYPGRITVVRRGDPGDSMFFISGGEVERGAAARRISVARRARRSDDRNRFQGHWPAPRLRLYRGAPQWRGHSVKKVRCRSSRPSSWSEAPASACGRCRAKACPSSSCRFWAASRPSSRPWSAWPTAACSAGR